MEAIEQGLPSPYLPYWAQAISSFPCHVENQIQKYKRDVNVEGETVEEKREFQIRQQER